MLLLLKIPTSLFAFIHRGRQMKLTYFSIEDYRSIGNAQFQDLMNVIILVGPNNEGKSNILRALNTCLTLLRGDHVSGSGETVRLRYGPDSFDWESDYPVQKQVKHPEGETVFELHFQLSQDEQSAFQQQTRSRLNDVLPIQLRLGPSPFASFKVLKQGRGGSALSKKAVAICRFVSTNLDFVYVPAIRTADTSIELINHLVSRELRQLEKNERYVEIQREIQQPQQPILNSIETKLKSNLQDFLGPSFKKVTLSLTSRQRLRPYGRAAQMTIDDGTPTPLDRKGDGVQSLVAISLMTRALEDSTATKDIILLIEEPESHLHPKAIHQLRDVLDTLKQDKQIVITTHCPALVIRGHVPANIIVSRNKASSAKSLEQLRDILGVRISDNLRHAALVIVVEGAEDSVALKALFSCHSPKLKSAIDAGSIAFEGIGGASKLRYALSQLQSSLCNYFVILDDDEEGRRAYKDAEKELLVSPSNTSFIKCIGLSEAELEDLYCEDVYLDYFKAKYSIDVGRAPFNSRKKWTHRIRHGMSTSGKSSASGEAWSENMEMQDKRAIAELVSKKPNDAILPARMSVINSIIAAIEAAMESVTS
jgi:predicted ATP-dependent endonuclease of OLD family